MPKLDDETDTKQARTGVSRPQCQTRRRSTFHRCTPSIVVGCLLGGLLSCKAGLRPVSQDVHPDLVVVNTAAIDNPDVADEPLATAH